MHPAGVGRWFWALGLMVALFACDDGGGGTEEPVGGAAGEGGAPEGGGEDEIPCVTYDNCEANQTCRAGACVPMAAGDCRTTADCSGTQTCGEGDGRCQEPSACAADADCLGDRYCDDRACVDPCRSEGDCGGRACEAGRCPQRGPYGRPNGARRGWTGCARCFERCPPVHHGSL